MESVPKNTVSDPLDSGECVAVDVFCVRCGANLRGRSVHDPCSGCYHPVSDSVWGDYLIYSHPTEIKRLCDAATLVIYGASLTVATVVAALIATLFGAGSIVDGVQRSFDMMFAGAMISPVVAGTGVALLTRRHSAAYYRAKFRSVRALLKPILIAIATVIVCVVTSYYFWWIVQSCVLVVWATAPTAMFFRGLARLMHGIPNKKLGSQSYAMFVCTWMLGVAALVVRLARPHVVGSVDWQGPVLALTFVAVLGGACLAFFGFRLLVLSRRAIRAAK